MATLCTNLCSTTDDYFGVVYSYFFVCITSYIENKYRESEIPFVSHNTNTDQYRNEMYAIFFWQEPQCSSANRKRLRNEMATN